MENGQYLVSFCAERGRRAQVAAGGIEVRRQEELSLETQLEERGLVSSCKVPCPQAQVRDELSVTWRQDPEAEHDPEAGRWT